MNIKTLIVFVGVAFLLASCAVIRPPVGGNVGALTDDEQSVIALDLFTAVQNEFDRAVRVSIRQETHGEVVFIEKLREAGVAVQRVDNDPDIKLDFYYFVDRGEYAGVVTHRNKRLIRRYAVENNFLVLLGSSVAWPGISRE